MQGVKYNIPVQIWLPEAYARHPPIMYVVPTSTMIIKPNHSFVDASGVVSSPYVRNWTPGRSVRIEQVAISNVLLPLPWICTGTGSSGAAFTFPA
jgi:ESCRT-I complex subunit TSG101